MARFAKNGNNIGHVSFCIIVNISISHAPTFVLSSLFVLENLHFIVKT
jgi:hypothetical protein